MHGSRCGPRASGRRPPASASPRETRVIAVRTYQVRVVHDRLLAADHRLSKSRRAARSSLAAAQESEREFLNEANGLLAASHDVAARIRAAGGSAPVDRTISSHGFIWPVSGPVTSPFGMRWGRMHEGIDIGVGYGTPIHAAGSGTVIYAGLGERVRQLHDHRPRRRNRHRVRPPVGDRRPRRRAGHAGRADRLRRLHGPLLRPASPLRGADQRHRGRPARVPLARECSTAPASARSGRRSARRSRP